MARGALFWFNIAPTWKPLIVVHIETTSPARDQRGNLGPYTLSSNHRVNWLLRLDHSRSSVLDKVVLTTLRFVLAQQVTHTDLSEPL